MFGRLGFNGASTRAIAAAAGIEQGHLVYYFKTKDQLWREVIEGYVIECERPLLDAQSKLAEDAAAVAVRQGLLGFLHTLADNPGLTRLLIGELSVSSPRHDWLFENVGKRLWQAARPLFEALGAEGYLSGVSPVVAYLNLLSSAMLVLGLPREIAQLAGGEAIAMNEDYIESLLQPVFGRAGQDNVARGLP